MSFDYENGWWMPSMEAFRKRNEKLEEVLRSGLKSVLDLAVYDDDPKVEFTEAGAVMHYGFTYEWLTHGSKPTLARKCVIYKLSEYKQPIMATMVGEWDADGREVAT